MTARKLVPALHGWLVVDKPAGLSSAAVVAKVRRAGAGTKAGHAGTLDPLATGVLPVALGEATKTVAFAMDGRKRYRFAVRFGEQRDTDDAEGAVIAESPVRPDRETLEAVLPRFRGAFDQVPPVFSAVKIGGQRAYALARAQTPVALAPRAVIVDRIALIERPDADHAVFEVDAGKGVYMRSLARDLALACGTVGHVAWLRRLAVGPFTEAQAVALARIEALASADDLQRLLLPVSTALADIPALALTAAEAQRLREGRPVAALPVARRSSFQGIARDTVVCAMTEGKPVALVEIRGGEIRPVRVLNL
jgi:tRNA pseudouridine55 synthase